MTGTQLTGRLPRDTFAGRRISALVPGARWWRRVRMRDAVVFSLPVVVGCLAIIWMAVGSFREYKQFDDWWSSGVHLNQLVAARIEALINAPRSAALEQKSLDARSADAAIIRLSVQRALWQSVHADALNAWDQWVDAELVRDNSRHPVKVRKRGDTSIHYTTPKRSFTIRTPRSAFYKGYRRMGFSGKDVLTQFVANSLSKNFDLIAPTTAVTPVFVNDRFYGVFRFIEPVDESFLRHNARMPGNVFRGDAAERGETNKNLPRNLFANPYIWDRVAANDRLTANPPDALRLFLDDLAGTRFEDHLRVMKWVDRAEISRLVALMLVVGDPYHMDGVHNQLWYEDPASGLLHPIPWDLRLLELAEGRLNDALRAFVRDPFVVDGAMSAIRQQLHDRGIVDTGVQLAVDAEKRFKPYFEYDRLRNASISDPGSQNKVRSILEHNARMLDRWMSDARVAFQASPADKVVILDFETRGYAGADLVALDVTLKGQPKFWRLAMDRNSNGILDGTDPIVAGEWHSTSTGARFTLKAPEPLLPGWSTPWGKGFLPGTVHYRFFLTGLDGQEHTVEPARPELRNRVTGQPAKVLPWQSGQTVTPSSSYSPWQFPVPQPRTHRLAGNVHLRTTLRVPEGDTLVIEPGTTLRLEPDVSIISRGRVVARGTAHRPIAVIPAVRERPWGTFVLQGRGADSSAFEHVKFTRGGGGLVDRVEYIGMVNVHLARGVLFQAAEFIENLRSDDGLHALHADVTIRDSYFALANSDAVDFDQSSGEIRDSRFEMSNNDAIDLMTSAPRIINNRISGSGDKGISVGEASTPFIFNNHISESNRGVEVKDGSEPVLLNNVITKNRIGILQDVKNWRYGGGGWAKLINTVVSGNGVDMSSDKDSRLTLARLDSAGEKQPSGPIEPPQIGWLYQHFGIDGTTASTSGLLDEWRETDAVLPLETATYADDFHDARHGWIPSAGVARLDTRNGNLVMALERKPGSMTRPVSWDLSGSSANSTLVLELGARDVERAIITVFSDRGTIVRSVETMMDASSYSFVAMPLPPARYRAVRIEATPRMGAWRVDSQTGFVEVKVGRVELHDYRLYRGPAR